ncbi:hypothetical protein G9O61_00g016430 [Vairimorpha ceranae]|nr:hypothetical protein G9O61_00g016430 [Vairimorpha ceranae]
MKTKENLNTETQNTSSTLQIQSDIYERKLRIFCKVESRIVYLVSFALISIVASFLLGFSIYKKVFLCAYLASVVLIVDGILLAIYYFLLKYWGSKVIKSSWV